MEKKIILSSAVLMGLLACNEANIVKWTEHKFYIHMNWGWDGSGNGWFFNNGNDRYKSLAGNKEIFGMLSIAPTKKGSAMGGGITSGSGHIFK